MRLHLLGLILMAGVATPALAQSNSVEQRVNRLEQELRAVQRRVFPNGRAQFVEPEIQPGQVQPPLPGGPGGDALSSLTSRVDALEAQLRTLTGQIEEQGFHSQQLEQRLGEIGARLERIEQQNAPPAAVAPPPAATEAAPPPAEEPVAEAAEHAAPAPVGDAAEDAYNAGYRLWNAGQFAQAQQALEAAATRYPDSRWTSWMRNLQGRAYLDDGKPATAARILLANYQDNPRGERAADSLYFLGQALTRLNRRTEACRVYDELAQVYPNMRDFIRTRLAQARTDARCAAN